MAVDRLKQSFRTKYLPTKRVRRYAGLSLFQDFFHIWLALKVKINFNIYTSSSFKPSAIRGFILYDSTTGRQREGLKNNRFNKHGIFLVNSFAVLPKFISLFELEYGPLELKFTRVRVHLTK